MHCKSVMIQSVSQWNLWSWSTWLCFQNVAQGFINSLSSI